MLRFYLTLFLSILCVSCNNGGIKNSLHSRQDKTCNNGQQEITSFLEIPVDKCLSNSQILTREGYVLSYNSDTRNCNWVAYELTKEEVEGEVSREKQFFEDLEVREPRATNRDYKGSGWSRGHMAPAGDMKWSKGAMYQSCLLTNICPQDASLNTGAWESVERKCRSLAKQKGKVYIVCGPLYNGHIRTIGANQIRVPDSFFKVILVPEGRSYSCVGFIFPNKPVPAAEINDYALCVNDVEQICGMDFFSNLPDVIEDEIESVIPWILVN